MPVVSVWCRYDSCGNWNCHQMTGGLADCVSKTVTCLQISADLKKALIVIFKGKYCHGARE